MKYLCLLKFLMEILKQKPSNKQKVSIFKTSPLLCAEYVTAAENLSSKSIDFTNHPG